MAMFFDTHLPTTGASNTAPFSVCAQTVALDRTRGYELPLAARCVR